MKPNRSDVIARENADTDAFVREAGNLWHLNVHPYKGLSFEQFTQELGRQCFGRGWVAGVWAEDEK